MMVVTESRIIIVVVCVCVCEMIIPEMHWDNLIIFRGNDSGWLLSHQYVLYHCSQC